MNKMKNSIWRIVALPVVVTMCLLTVSCEDMLSPDSNNYLFDRDENLKNPNDSLYSVMGILSQVQKVGEQYVLFGELRGDLMSVSENASVSLKEMSQLQFSKENTYAAKSNFYSVINNCNYAIARMDTTILNFQDKVMLPEYVAIKTIRAWTYLQIAQVFGSAYYYTDPILDLAGAEKEYPELDMNQLIDRLIPDLLPHIDVRTPDYGSIDGKSSKNFFIPIRMLLGDMYLCQNKYEQAAVMYHDLIVKEKYTVMRAGSFWNDRSRTSASVSHPSNYSMEAMTIIPYSSDPKNYHTDLFRLSYNTTPVLLPATTFMEEMANRAHFFMGSGSAKIDAYLKGDLRGTVKSPTVMRPGSYGQLSGKNGTNSVVMKYASLSTSIGGGWDPQNPEISGLQFTDEIPIYRIPHLYLRYAEAVNRAGKPTLAFAVLKHGLTPEIIDSATIVNPSEVANLESYTRFDSYFDINVPMAVRGRGQGVHLDNMEFIIPQLATKQDSIECVENYILDELAAETAFEGNRFFDLLRISRHRSDHPELMATKVSKRFSNPQEAKNRLMIMSNWYAK